MTGLQQIIAIGGHGLTSSAEDLTLSRYILDQVPVPHPRICFLSQAGGEDAFYIANFYRHFLALDAVPSDLSLFRPHTADIVDFLLQQDAIYVGGGNTRSMLALWREWRLDRILRQAWQNGTLLSGVSAGAICWFEQGLTDSIPGKLTPLPCLGFLPGSCSPHFDGEPQRRPSYHRLIADSEMMPGFGIDDYAALHFIGVDSMRAVASRAGANAYRVESSTSKAEENRLDATVLAAPNKRCKSQSPDNLTRTDAL